MWSLDDANAMRKEFDAGEVLKAYTMGREMIMVGNNKEVNPALLVYLATLVELKKPIEVYNLSHELIKKAPEHPLTYYSIALHRHLIRNDEEARHYMGKNL
ncbi:hypothetical protein L596_014806 [Steinernema carpocapsae]|uniref:Uncharacterized protein n=1 Tax=Steinernema carpocapsae TaxID=34508 RepID=A0A4U5ND86_STECR|nr:hypothetical protein L596_014806 [Steinernema carpocapsae]